MRYKSLVKIVYTFDEDAMMMRENVTYIYQSDFNGTQVKVECTPDYVTLTKADGDSPGIYFYDQDFEQLEYFKLPE